jgi:hypothetical protein
MTTLPARRPTMPDQSHEDPTAEGAARAAQLAAMVLSIGEGAARLRSERLSVKAADDERQAAALRARHRTEQAAAWLTARTRGPQPGAPAAVPPAAGDPAAPGAGGTAPTWSVTIVCTPQDLAAQAFPVPVPDAMATAPQAARDAVHAARALAAPTRRAQLTAGPTPTGGVSR